MLCSFHDLHALSTIDIELRAMKQTMGLRRDFTYLLNCDGTMFFSDVNCYFIPVLL